MGQVERYSTRFEGEPAESEIPSPHRVRVVVADFIQLTYLVLL